MATVKELELSSSSVHEPSAPNVTDRLPPTSSGIRFVPASNGCYYPPQVEPRDILEVDFDVRELQSDGLYLICLPKFGWRGCRRFQARGDGWYMDNNAKQDWQRLSPTGDLEIVGIVREVYKPVGEQMEAVNV